MSKNLLYTSLLLLVFNVLCNNCLKNWDGWKPKYASDSLTCNPQTDCNATAIGSKVPDPSNCTNYYLCVDSNGRSVPSNAPLPCPDGNYFDLTTSECVTQTKPCTGNCIHVCKLYCVMDFDYLADPSTCNNFIVCVEGSKILMTCSEDLPYFDGINCTADPYACCDACTPYCPSANVQVPDPIDCKSFFICLDIGVPTEDTHFTCLSDQHFDYYSGVCIDDVSGEVCEALCQITASTIPPAAK